MSETVTTSFRDGDVFRWHYKEGKDPHGSTNPYWCCSRIAIASRGRLFDTYWGVLGGEHKSFSVDDERLELSHLGNMDDFDLRPGYEAAYYHSSDIMDLRHSNDTSAFYVRKGAPRNREAMLNEAGRLLEAAERDASAAQYRVDGARKLITELKAGADLNSVYL